MNRLTKPSGSVVSIPAIIRGLSILHLPGDTFEIRALGCNPWRGRKFTSSGYFRDAISAWR